MERPRKRKAKKISNKPDTKESNAELEKNLLELEETTNEITEDK